MPFISWLFGTRDMSALNLIVRPEIVENGAVVQEAITIGFGSFVAVVIDFLLMSLVVFIILKLFNKARAMTEKKVEAGPEEESLPPPPSSFSPRSSEESQKIFRGEFFRGRFDAATDTYIAVSRCRSYRQNRETLALF